MISVSHISKSYGKKTSRFVALDDISFEVPEGSSLAIVGKSGSGKSTLLHVMSGMDRPDSGTVTLADTDITALKDAKLAQFRAHQMGFVFQSFFVQAAETCFQNVALPLEIGQMKSGKRNELVRQALDRVGLADKITAKANDLSGGQKQRLAIARAIVHQPKIIFADEPTGNLDSATGEQIIDLLFALNQETGTTLVIVTHDEELASRCQWQLVIKDGKVDSFGEKKS